MKAGSAATRSDRIDWSGHFAPLRLLCLLSCSSTEFVPMPAVNIRIIIIFSLFCLFFFGIRLRDRILVSSLHRIEQTALIPPSGKLLFEGAMSGMLGVLHNDPAIKDDYACYIPSRNQKEYENSFNNRFDGIGVMLDWQTTENGVLVLFSFLRSPAFRAGLRFGDLITAVDGEDVKGKPAGEISGKIRGTTGTKAKLIVERKDLPQPLSLEVERLPILYDSVEGDRLDEQGNRVFVLETEPEIGYIRIKSFGDRTFHEMVVALNQLKNEKLTGLILDVRGNPGGYVDSVIKIANLFLEPPDSKSVIVKTHYRNSTDPRYAVSGVRLCTLPLVMLIDDQSASASEILAGALQDYHLARIVGTRSFGKGVVQQIVPLPVHSGAFQFTNAEYRRPSGKNIHRRPNSKETDEWGVSPAPEDICPVSQPQQMVQYQLRDYRSNVLQRDLPQLIDYFRSQISTILKSELPEEESEWTVEGAAPYFDPQLERAIEILKKQTEPQS